MADSEQQRNLDPHRPARCAMWLFDDEYSRQSGGIMDFWDKLSERNKSMCRRMAEAIITTRPETDNERNGSE